jgi:SAM-dependent methyltransferase
VAKQDPAGAAFWEQRYREQFMPWDAGRVPDLTQTFIATLAPDSRVLIPGCGSAYEARAFAEAGHEVIAVDFSAAALDAARGVLGEWAQCLRLGDFFTMDFGGPFDVVYERAFLCALPRRAWPDYAPRVAELLRPGELEALLDDAFERSVDVAVTDSIPVFQGKERWQVWLRNRGHRPA